VTTRPTDNRLDYWTPAVALPVPVLPVRGRPADRTDWLTLLVVVAIAAALAFAVVIALAWVLGH
jgi:hypothetical protein